MIQQHFRAKFGNFVSKTTCKAQKMSLLLVCVSEICAIFHRYLIFFTVTCLLFTVIFLDNH